MNTRQVIANNTKCFTGNLPSSSAAQVSKKKAFFQEKKGLLQYSYYLPAQYFWPLLTPQAVEDEVFKVSGERKNATQHKFLPRHVPLLSQNFTPKLFSVRAARWSKDFAFFLNSTASREASSGYSWKGRVSKLLFREFLNFFSILGKNDL